MLLNYLICAHKKRNDTRDKLGEFEHHTINLVKGPLADTEMQSKHTPVIQSVMYVQKQN